VSSPDRSPDGPELLDWLIRRGVFVPAPDPDRLVDFYLPFGLLPGSQEHPEARLEVCVRRRGKACVVGLTGTGKSSLISHVLGKVGVEYAPIVIRASGEGDVVLDPLRFAKHLLRTVTRHAEEISLLTTNERAEVLRDAGVADSATHRTTVRGGAPRWLFTADVAHEITQAVRVQADSVDEILGIVSDVLLILTANGMMPVFVFDDTDRWVGTGQDNSARLAVGFFGTTLRLVSDLKAGLVIAAHDNYLAMPVYKEHAAPLWEVLVRMPLLTEPRQLALVLEHRIRVAGPAAEAAAVFEPAAVDCLYGHYEADGARKMRKVIQAALNSLGVAAQERRECVTAADVIAYLADAADI
jgi:hypothetical protein